jgi:hypothetical protein
MLRGAHVAQAAKPADEAKPYRFEKKRTPSGVWQAKQAWQPALRLSDGNAKPVLGILAIGRRQREVRPWERGHLCPRNAVRPHIAFRKRIAGKDARAPRIGRPRNIS